MDVTRSTRRARSASTPVNSQNSTDTADGCNTATNCFFKYARRSGQAQYSGALGVQSRNHPITFNQGGGDYGWSQAVYAAGVYVGRFYRPPRRVGGRTRSDLFLLGGQLPGNVQRHRAGCRHRLYRLGDTVHI